MINLLTDRPTAFTALAAVEGQDWLDGELYIPTDPDWELRYGKNEPQENSLLGVLYKLDNPNKKRKDTKFPIATLYGSGGYHRYLIYTDGHVRFSRHHAMNGDVSKAQAAGIEVLN